MALIPYPNKIHQFVKNGNGDIFHPVSNHTMFRHRVMSWSGSRSKLLGVNNKRVCFLSSTCHRTVAQCKRTELLKIPPATKSTQAVRHQHCVISRESAPFESIAVNDAQCSICPDVRSALVADFRARGALNVTCAPTTVKCAPRIHSSLADT